jgi:hypothetical protein
LYDDAVELINQFWLSCRKEPHRSQPNILHGRTPQELPPRTIGTLSYPVLCAMTGPEDGLTAVNKNKKHLDLSANDPDIDFIDDQAGEFLRKLCT